MLNLGAKFEPITTLPLQGVVVRIAVHLIERRARPNEFRQRELGLSKM
jgi:hypothetical protein